MRAGPLLMDDLQQESRRYLASYVMFNQAVADHLELHPTDVQCLNLMTAESGPFTTGRIARKRCGIFTELWAELGEGWRAKAPTGAVGAFWVTGVSWGVRKIARTYQGAGVQRWSGMRRSAVVSLSASSSSSVHVVLGGVAVSVRGRWRQRGDLPWASARMRCFIVGGRALAKDQGGAAGAVRCCGTLMPLPFPLLLRFCSACGTAAAAVVVMNPSAVHRARKAVTMAVHSFMTLLRAMGPSLSGWAICVLSS